MNIDESPSGFGAITDYLVRQVDWRFMVLPPLLALSMAYAIVQGYYLPGKSIMEFIGLATMAYFFIACVLRYRLAPTTFTLGCIWISFAFLSREIHYPGSDVLVYASIILLAFLIVTRFEFFRPYIDQRLCFTLFAMAFFAYFISQSTDQRWWRFMPYEDVTHMRLEETMEIVGHLCLGTSLILWQQVSGKAVQACDETATGGRSGTLT